MVLVTVGLPVYNAEPYLADAIQSVMNQSLKDWELLLIDDGSSDNSLSVAQSFTDPRIKIISDGKNRGGAARRNQINQLAQGRYIALFDADDIMTPNRLLDQVSWLEQNTTVDMVGSYLYTITVRNTVYGIRGATSIPETIREAIHKNPIAQPTVMARREWFLANPYDEQIGRCHDFELWLRTIEHSKFAIIDKPLIFYREAGIPYLDKYTRGITTIQKLLKNYRQRRKLGLTYYLRARLGYFVKGLVYRVLAVLDAENWLLTLRNRQLDADELTRAQSLLARAIARNQPDPSARL
ncbi:glycosyltransferase family 2 protein [Larkinella arboricola]